MISAPTRRRQCQRGISVPSDHMTLPVFVDEGVEGHAVPPAGGKVVDVDVGVPAEEGKKFKEMLSAPTCNNKKKHSKLLSTTVFVALSLTRLSSSDTTAAVRLWRSVSPCCLRSPH